MIYRLHLYSLCYRYANRIGDIDFNPCENVKIPVEKAVASKKKKIPFLDTDDIEKLYHEADRLNENGFNITGVAGTRVYNKKHLDFYLKLTHLS